MTAPVNNKQMAKVAGYPWPIDKGGSFDINQGDMVWFDTTAHEMKPADTDAHMASFAGVACDSSVISLYTNPSNAAVKQYSDGLMVLTEGVFFFKTTAGDTYHPGDTVYIGADAQTVTNTVGGNTHPVGVVMIINGAASTTVAGATGTTVGVLILPQWPGTGVA